MIFLFDNSFMQDVMQPLMWLLAFTFVFWVIFSETNTDEEMEESLDSHFKALQESGIINSYDYEVAPDGSVKAQMFITPGQTNHIHEKMLMMHALGEIDYLTLEVDLNHE